MVSMKEWSIRCVWVILKGLGVLRVPLHDFARRSVCAFLYALLPG